ncbi:MAG TPA: exodeoxyribonuclease VII large subunit [Vicinamibacterales bacterium]|nr:exodeoxyribonuclease VII large subunit [Vicinamibacterales bacterium]
MSMLPFDDPVSSPPEDEKLRRGQPARPAPMDDEDPAHRKPSEPAAPVAPSAPVARAPLAPAAPVAPAAPAVRRLPLTVSQLSARLRNVVEETFDEIWVQGEISGGRTWNSGHFYFTLKDANAQIKGVVFRSTLRLLKFKPTDGLCVTVRGRISVYEPKGEYQLVCEHLEPQGLGELQLAFEQLKKKLAAEGLFAETRKRPLPALPRRIGIVTSIDGAALRDIVRVLRRRYPNAHLVISPTRVQGEGASGEIARALRLVARIDHVDVVIVGRGGGSLEDLWAFNEEIVARAIAACPIPVISAVGHETDVTIADFAADLRAPTPSAAAEMVVRQKDEFTAHIRRLVQQLRAAMLNRVRRFDSRLHALQARPGFAGYPGRMAWRSRHVGELTSDLKHAARGAIAARRRRLETARRTLDQFDPRHRLARVRATLVGQDVRLRGAATRRLHRVQGRFRELAAHLDGLSPLAVLGRGYAVCWDGERTRIVRDAESVAPGDPIRVTLERGEIRARVTDS